MAYIVEYVPIGALKTHEAIKEGKAMHFARYAKYKRRRFRMKPIIVDRRSMVILDAHHRYAICRTIGYKRVPCIFVEYLADPLISVLPRNPAIAVTKESVITMGSSKKVFPPKTTKHIFADPVPEIWVDMRKCIGEY